MGTIQAVLAALVALLPLSTPQRYTNDRVGLMLELLLCAAIATVGRWPLQASMVAAALLTSFLAVPMDSQRPTRIAMVIVIATLGARGLSWLRTVITAWWLVITILIDNTPPRELSVAVMQGFVWVLVGGAAWALGEAVRRVSVERARGQLDRTAAVQAQRRSIARDLHDTIAYSTTSIILRAEQAKLRGVTDPDVAADLDYIINAGRNTMRDLRGMMETLRRNDPDGSAPQAPWQVSSLDEVLAARLAELRNNGFAVTSNVDVDRAALPESAREALTKVLVEATGNMITHGDPAGPASILIEGDPDEVEAVFINRPKRPGSPRVASAHLGLVGARERVEALGGEVDVTSESPDWVVRVRIPLGG
jgi:signal transduction histidine kinase